MMEISTSAMVCHCLTIDIGSLPNLAVLAVTLCIDNVSSPSYLFSCLLHCQSYAYTSNTQHSPSCESVHLYMLACSILAILARSR